MKDYNLQCVKKKGGSMAMSSILNNNNATQRKKKIDGQRSFAQPWQPQSGKESCVLRAM
jgi:hypothetical protein